MLHGCWSNVTLTYSRSLSHSSDPVLKTNMLTKPSKALSACDHITRGGAGGDNDRLYNQASCIRPTDRDTCADQLSDPNNLFNDTAAISWTLTCHVRVIVKWNLSGWNGWNYCANVKNVVQRVNYTAKSAGTSWGIPNIPIPFIQHLEVCKSCDKLNILQGEWLRWATCFTYRSSHYLELRPRNTRLTTNQQALGTYLHICGYVTSILYHKIVEQNTYLGNIFSWIWIKLKILPGRTYRAIRDVHLRNLPPAFH